MKTPTEDDLKEWNAPFIPVATITIPPQILYSPDSDEYKGSTPDQQKNAQDLWAACENATFTPAHYVSQDRPLSNMGRGRVYSYAASARGRGAESSVALPLDPSHLSVWKKSVQLNAPLPE